MHSAEGFVVAPRSRADIRRVTDEIRSSLGASTPNFPIIDVLEFVLPKVFPDFCLEFYDPEHMDREFGPGTHGMTYPDEYHMVIREDVYEAAYRGSGFERFSLCHEFGHLMLHRGDGLARRVVSPSTPAYAKSEWQANTFAGELLVDWKQVGWDATTTSIARRFGVSPTAADIQLKVLQKEGLI